MAIVRIEPSGIELDVKPKESVAEAAWREGYEWPTKCWGQAECMLCITKVLDGELAAEPAGDEEAFEMRTRLPARMSNSLNRLGCRLLVCDDGLVLEKRGVRPVNPAGDAAEAG